MKNKIKLYGVLLLASFLLFTACEDKSDLTAPAAPSSGDVDFSSFVSLGNSLTAGYQNASLYQSSQDYSIGKMLSGQVTNVKYEQPLYSNPGTASRMEIQSLAGPVIGNNPNSGSPLNLSYPAPYNNLGVPGALMPEALIAKDASTSLTNNPMFDLILRGQGTMVEQAIALSPTFVTVWLGNNDILGYATSGGLLPHTPVAAFQQAYPLIVGALAQTGTKGVVANIPDVRATPFFRTVGPATGAAIKPAFDASQIAGLVYQHSTTVIGVATPDALIGGTVLMTLTGSPYAGLLGDTEGKYYEMTGQTPPAGVNTAFPFGFTPENPWPNSLILDDAELATVVDVTNSFNQTIKASADAVGFKLADMYTFFNDVAQNGYVADGLNFSAGYILGGLFSLDGVHPTTRGYGIIANKLVEVINDNYNASIPMINISTLPASIPLSNWTAKKVSEIQFSQDAFEHILY